MSSNTKKSIHILVGTRPNFIKITRFKELGIPRGIDVKIIHTGQHYDKNMSEIFFEQFNLVPDHFLGLEKASPIDQISGVLQGLEKLYREIEKPDLFIVPGDVNSTLAGAVAANKLGLKLAHLESGLRSFQRDMPEEHNRVVADQLSDLCFVTEISGMKNLELEKIAAQAFHVGNTMIDTLVAFDKKIQQSSILETLKLNEGEYYLVTFHRPENVDSKERLVLLISILQKLSEKNKVVFPIHPRTKSNLEKLGLIDKLEILENVIIANPMGYFEFQKLIANSKAVFTDSGGIQEETTFRQIPCVTLRKSTERPITTDIGSNTLIGLDLNQVIEALNQIESGGYKKGEVPKYWDGHTTERILDIVDEQIF